jgi:hypothetical protein
MCPSKSTQKKDKTKRKKERNLKRRRMRNPSRQIIQMIYSMFSFLSSVYHPKTILRKYWRRNTSLVCLKSKCCQVDNPLEPRLNCLEKQKKWLTSQRPCHPAQVEEISTLLRSRARLRRLRHCRSCCLSPAATSRTSF